MRNLPLDGGIGGRKHDDTGKWNFNDDTTQEYSTKNSFYHGPSYQMMNIDALEKVMNEVCVCKCVVDRDLDNFLTYCSTVDNQMTIDEARHHREKWKQKQIFRKKLQINIKNIGLAVDFTTECQKCKKTSIPRMRLQNIMERAMMVILAIITTAVGSLLISSLSWVL